VLFAFGSGGLGQLGLGDRNNRLVPAVGRSRFGGARIAYAAAGVFHSGAVTLEGGGVDADGKVASGTVTRKSSWYRGSSRGSLGAARPSCWPLGMLTR